MLSMTGFSSLTKENDAFSLQIDIKAVNSKYCDLRINAGFCDNNFLEVLRKYATEQIGRGQVSVELKLTAANAKDAAYALDTDQINRYISDFEQSFGVFEHDFSRVKEFLKLENTTKMSEFVFNAERDGDFVEAALAEAFAQFNAAREEEGARLETDLLEKVCVLETIRAAIMEKVPELEASYRKRLEERMLEFIEKLDEVDESRILSEVAVHAIKTTIDEELVRLASHLTKLKNLIKSDDKFIGKKMDFYMQEINREYNTIASKISDVVVAEQIVNSKVIVDQIREQAQNIM